MLRLKAGATALPGRISRGYGFRLALRLAGTTCCEMRGDSLASKEVVIPAKAGIQYAAASRSTNRRLWNTGSSAFADDDIECAGASRFRRAGHARYSLTRASST